MKLYHYTPAHNLDNIKKQGLFHFGVGFFTSSEEKEATVSLIPGVAIGRIIIENSPKTKKFSEYVTTPYYYNLFSDFMLVDVLTKIFDTSEWYFTEDEVLSSDIIGYEVEINGIWTKYKKDEK